MPILAYIDPGSGSLLIQLAAGGVAGLAAFFKFRWRGFKSKLRSTSDNSPLDSKSPPEAAE